MALLARLLWWITSRYQDGMLNSAHGHDVKIPNINLGSNRTAPPAGLRSIETVISNPKDDEFMTEILTL